MNATSSSPKVLIVDDTKTNIAILVEALREEYKLGVATSGVKALEYVAVNHPDLILLDIMMPEMDGYETCARLKAEEETRGIPVIFITALNEIEDKTKGFELGAVDYITKPFEVVEVQARVKTHLKIEQYREELEERNRELERVQARLQHQVKELEGRDRLVHAQMSVATSGQAVEGILKAVTQVLECDQAAVYQPLEGEDLLAVTGLLGGKELPGTVAADNGESLVSRAFVQEEPLCGEAGEVAVPLLYRKKPLGVLWLRGTDWGAVGPEDGLQTLWRLAGEASLVLHAARLAEELASGDLQIGELLDLDESGFEGSERAKR